MIRNLRSFNSLTHLLQNSIFFKSASIRRSLSSTMNPFSRERKTGVIEPIAVPEEILKSWAEFLSNFNIDKDIIFPMKKLDLFAGSDFIKDAL